MIRQEKAEEGKVLEIPAPRRMKKQLDEIQENLDIVLALLPEINRLQTKVLELDRRKIP